LLLAGIALPAVAHAQCVTDTPAVDACAGGVKITTPPGLSLDLSFMTPGSLDGRITFTRGSIGTYFDVAGTLQTATTNTPRWDYNPTTHALNGLLIEEQRTNSVTNSGPLTDFAVDFSTKTTAATTAPDGTATGVRITEDTSGAEHSIDFTIPSTVGNTAYTATVFMKANTRTNMALEFRVAGNWVGGNCVIVANLSGAGSLFTGTGTPTASTIKNVGNGWYQVSLTVTSAASPSGTSQLRIGLANSSTNWSYTGDGASNAYAWGAQLEVGAFPTSYIPTTAAGVTRSPDIATMPTAAWFNASTSSLAADFMVAQSPNPSALVRDVCALSDATANNRLMLRGQIASAATAAFGTSVAGATTASGSLGAATANAVAKVAASWNGTTGVGSLNGAAAVSYAVGMPAGLTTLTVGNDYSGAAAYLNGWVRRVRYWPRALSNAELQSVTT